MVAVVYATFADMRARFRESDLVQLADVDAINDAQGFVEGRLTKAGSVIDGYVAAYYAPRAGLPVPQILTELACDITFYQMHRAEPPEKVKDDYKTALATLRDISKGLVKIDDGAEAVPEREGAVLVTAPGRIFDRESMRGY